MIFLKFPNYIKTEVCKNLLITDLISLSKTCRLLNTLINNSQIIANELLKTYCIRIKEIDKNNLRLNDVINRIFYINKLYDSQSTKIPSAYVDEHLNDNYHVTDKVVQFLQAALGMRSFYEIQAPQKLHHTPYGYFILSEFLKANNLKLVQEAWQRGACINEKVCNQLLKSKIKDIAHRDLVLEFVATKGTVLGKASKELREDVEIC